MKLILTLTDIENGEIEVVVSTDEELGGMSKAEMVMGNIVEFLHNNSVPCPVYEMVSELLH